LLPDAQTIETVLADVAGEVQVVTVALGVVARTEVENVNSVLSALKASGYESLVDFDGIDTGEQIELSYRLRSYSQDVEVWIKTTLPYGGTIVSAWNIYAGALMPERETAELFGLKLAGHPNPKRLVTTDGVAPLLLKSVPIRTPEEVRRP